MPVRGLIGRPESSAPPNELPAATQLRHGDTPPVLAAMVRTDQWVCASGLEFCVSSTISWIFDSGITGLRPRSGFTDPSFFNPSSAKRARQAPTVPGFTPTTRPCSTPIEIVRPRKLEIASNYSRLQVRERTGFSRPGQDRPQVADGTLNPFLFHARDKLEHQAVEGPKGSLCRP
jgi:hypothetical protein